MKNKYLDKSHIYNCANYRAFDGDSDVLRSLSLESFNSIRDKERYKRIVEKAKYYLNRNKKLILILTTNLLNKYAQIS